MIIFGIVLISACIAILAARAEEKEDVWKNIPEVENRFYYVGKDKNDVLMFDYVTPDGEEFLKKNGYKRSEWKEKKSN